MAAKLSGLVLLRWPWRIPLAAFISRRISARFRSVVTFARRIADGDLTARIDAIPAEAGPFTGIDALSSMEAALNETAERLGKDFAELESGRDELAVMLDSMQEAVVAITSAGSVRWSNAVMQRIAGSQLRAGPSAGPLRARSRAAGLRARRA